MKLVLENKDQIFIKQKWICTDRKVSSYKDETTCSIRESDGNMYVEDINWLGLFKKLFNTTNLRECLVIRGYIEELLGFKKYEEQEQSACIDVISNEKYTYLVVNGKKFTVEQLKEEAISKHLVNRAERMLHSL